MTLLQRLTQSPDWLLIPVIIWTVFWKVSALIQAFKNKQWWWFIALIFLNTFGLLDIIYLARFQEDKSKPNQPNII